ncbi:MAG: DNA repair ATPase [Bacteroidetes bacterium]|nr:DNA repair ATPase [Bacteroidota bacterium]
MAEKSNISDSNSLETGAYTIIRERLQNNGKDLQARLKQLNDERRLVFGATDTRLIANERISTEHNCLARDIVPVGNDFFWFGYNVQIGLKAETHISDVFSIYRYDRENHRFQSTESPIFEDPQFQLDFQNLYQYYRETRFSKFALIGPYLFMVFQVGKKREDIKTFKWALKDGAYHYVDNRSDHEFRFPEQHQFKWTKVNRDMHRKGLHPHISISDRLFVETIGGDLTLKVEDNTNSGKGIYSEAVDNADQTLDDADISFAEVGNIILLKIQPYLEDDYRYIIFNEKIQEAKRVDAIKDACVLLPEDQGLIFAKGYYIQSGEVKLFDNELQGMQFEKRINSPNGEDVLYVFYQPESGTYALMRYNLIEQEVSTPIICSGYSLFEDGEMIYFRAEEEQTKHHLIQIWQTPFYSPNRQNEASNDSYLAKLGNKEIVRAMSESRELLKLVYKEDNYQGLYNDLTKKSSDILDSYHWLGSEEAYQLEAPLLQIRDTAKSAIDEYEKVVQLKKDSSRLYEAFEADCQKKLRALKAGLGNHIDAYVKRMAEIRSSRGELLGLKDLPYVNTEGLNELEEKLAEASEHLAAETANFLVKEKALNPYRDKLDQLVKNSEALQKSIDAKKLEEESLQLSQELEMLIETVSNLQIEDATQSTEIIDRISDLYAAFNQAKAGIKRSRKELVLRESASEFKAQLRLADQSLSNFIELADEPEKCDSYLNKMMIQLEELESRFSESEEFLDQISNLRDEVYNTFETKKIQLKEARNRRALKLSESGKRILEGIQRRLQNMASSAEIQSYYASDFMVLKLRDQAKALVELGDSVKADELESQLKSTYEDALRQLKDRQELYADGDKLIQLGKHRFSVNHQEIDLSLVQRENGIFLHINGTGFFEAIESDDLEACRPVWEQHLRSENERVYRAEFLAYSIFKAAKVGEESWNLKELHQLAHQELLPQVQKEMSSRFQEAYVKGVHDEDASKILEGLLKLHFELGLLRHPAKARLWALYTWDFVLSKEQKQAIKEEFNHVKSILQFFPNSTSFKSSKEALAEILQSDSATAQLLKADANQLDAAVDFCFDWLSQSEALAFSQEARTLVDAFQSKLRKSQALKRFEADCKQQADEHWSQAIKRIHTWLAAFTSSSALNINEDHFLEAAYLLGLSKLDAEQGHVHHTQLEIDNMRGEHPNIVEGSLSIDYRELEERLQFFSAETIPLYERFQNIKKELLRAERRKMGLSEFKPRIMSSFVRNELLDEVYLPMIGDNLAKQIGAAGKDKRTDLMGMLLLISPPGYGKTTLMEYIAARLGLVFMKINGPALGHDVKSVDPEGAPNAGAREELYKLNLAFEMGDNVMIYLDDIQHCNPEFLQKFISLCDAQRKIEGVYKGEAKTYDFRGKKVAVIMAGNPYTESGDKFQIPDMLANRADIYNLGDIIGGKAEAFELSYIENSLSSNRSLARLADKPRADLKSFLRAAVDNQQDLDLKDNYSATEKEELLKVLRLAYEVRRIVLMVNQRYIHSAGQADAFRSEPPFKLQGSYRDMNKLCEKLSAMMNESELEQILLSHYENESQTLTQGAEFNFLRLKQLLEKSTPEEEERLAEILKAYQKQQQAKGYGSNQVAPIVERLEQMGFGLQELVRIFENENKLNTKKE